MPMADIGELGWQSLDIHSFRPIERLEGEETPRFYRRRRESEDI